MIGFGYSVVTLAINQMLGKASLNLNFSLSNALDPRITFSRTSNATLTGSNGLIQYAPHNLLTYSEQFYNAAWTKSGASVSANVTVSPDGTTTADKLVEDTSTGEHRVFSATVTWLSSTTYSVSFYAKAAERSRFDILFGAAGNWVNGDTARVASFDVATGTITTSPISPGAASIQSVGNGWYRCRVTATAVASPSASAVFLRMADTSGNAAYTGNGTSGLYIWGAQLEIGSTATNYNLTTVKNLLGYTQEFDNAAWTKSNSSISATKVAAPDGSLTGQKVIANTTLANHYVQSSAASIAGGANVTSSAYVKAAGYSFVRITAYNAAITAGFRVDVNLSTGVGSTSVFGAGSSASGYSVTDVGNGWYRVSVTGVADASSTSLLQWIQFADNASMSGFVGDGTSGIYIWGAQLSDSASLDPYVYNPVAAPTAAAYYGPRFDYDPVTLAPKGLLIEEQRSQLLLNSSLAGTSLATQNVTVTAVAHTLSFYGTGQIVLSGTATETVTGTGAYPSRQTYTFTPTAGTLTLTVTGTVQFAQLEVGAFATSFIPSGASQVTRAADVASMLGANFSNWYNQSEGTFYSDTLSYGGTTSSRSLSAFGTSAAEQISIGADVMRIRTGSVDIGSFFTLVVLNGKRGLAYALNQQAGAKDGTVQSSTNAGLPSGIATLYIGSSNTGAQLNGTIKRIAYYNRRLSNSELQGITT